MKWFLGILIGAAALLAAYTGAMLHWSYAKGERAGYVQKFSKKGWICKTWEGEIALVSLPGTVSDKFAFTVRDDAVAEEINRNVGSRISLTYEQHVGLPTTCFGETGYFVTGIAKVAETP